MGVLGITEVLTEGGYIKVSDIKIGALVVTQDNQYHKVIIKRVSKAPLYMYKVDVSLNLPLYITEDQIIIANTSHTIGLMKVGDCVIGYFFNYNPTSWGAEAIFYDIEVKDIHKIKSKDEFIYDIKVEENNTFVANGVILGGLI